MTDSSLLAPALLLADVAMVPSLSMRNRAFILRSGFFYFMVGPGLLTTDNSSPVFENGLFSQGSPGRCVYPGPSRYPIACF